MVFPNPFRFAWAMIRATAAKNVILSDAAQKERLAICERPCPQLDAGSRQCKICTCFIDLKVLLATEHCPKGYWPPVKLTFARWSKPLSMLGRKIAHFFHYAR